MDSDYDNFINESENSNPQDSYTPPVSGYLWLETYMGWIFYNTEHPNNAWIYNLNFSAWMYVSTGEGVNPGSWCYFLGSWRWSSPEVYPYFFDNKTSSWMYFESDSDESRFYHYGTKQWIIAE